MRAERATGPTGLSGNGEVLGGVLQKGTGSALAVWLAAAGTDQTHSATALLNAVKAGLVSVEPDDRGELESFLHRPEDLTGRRSCDGFVIHYALSGPDAPLAGHGFDYLAELETACRHVFAVYHEPPQSWPVPPPDGVDGDAIDIYIRDLGAGVFGYALHEECEGAAGATGTLLQWLETGDADDEARAARRRYEAAVSEEEFDEARLALLAANDRKADEEEMRNLWTAYWSMVWVEAAVESWWLTPRPSVRAAGEGVYTIDVPRARAAAAAVASAVVPGAGQRMVGCSGRGNRFTAAVLSLGAASILAQDAFLEARREQNKAQRRYELAETEEETLRWRREAEAAADRVTDRGRVRWALVGATVGVYLWNIWDAATAGAEIAVPTADAGAADGLGYLEGVSLDAINAKAYAGTRTAHITGGVPCLGFELERLDPETMGAMIYLFEKAVAISGLLLEVNPFDQPGVEMYKREMFRLLGKP